MNSTLHSTAAPAAWSSAVVDTVLLPAAVAAPAALVIAVEKPVAQETSALRQDTSAHTYAAAFNAVDAADVTALPMGGAPPPRAPV